MYMHHNISYSNLFHTTAVIRISKYIKQTMIIFASILLHVMQLSIQNQIILTMQAKC